MELYRHNRMAYESALSLLEETGKAAVVHPTGTGKSFIAFQLCEDNPDKTVLWLSPSEYIFKTQIENLKATGAKVPQNIVYCTYASLANMSGEEMRAMAPDFMVWDEFHRAGSPVWGAAARKLLEIFPRVPVLGLSATAIRYLDNQRDMADELFEGNVASEMTLGEAIVRGILNPPRYVTTVYAYQSSLEKYRRRVHRLRNAAQRDRAEEVLDAFRRALEKADGLDVIFQKHMTDPHGKYIVFCANKEHMDEMMDKAGEWFRLVDGCPRVYSLYSEDPGASQSFENFKQDENGDHLRLLYCIDALNEGIHVENVSGVILLRPTVSPIIYKQQIGRALSASRSNTPLIFDIVNNFENLYSIGSIEEEMRAAITYYNYFGDGEKIVTERFQVIDEVRECRRLFNELEETLTNSWETMYACAKNYHAEYGSLDVPTTYKTPDGYSLGSWLQTQRRIRAGKVEGLLGEERIAKLDALGMRWESVNDLSWQRHYAACKAYREEHGDLNVPGDYVTADGLSLGKWILAVRNYRRYGIKSNYFTAEREKLLDGLGMVWDTPDYLWNRNYEAAKSYFEKHGDLNVPAGHVENGVKLYNWLGDLRKKYRDQALTAEQTAQLDALQMRWKTKNDLAWDKGYAHAKAYAETHGAADAPLQYVAEDGFKLGVWLAKCREKYAKGALTGDKIRQLEAVHMVWSKSNRNDWDGCFELVKDYLQRNGNLRIPPDYVAQGVWLNKWLNEQKLILQGRRAKKRLSEEQERKLRSIGFTGREQKEIRWGEKYAELKAYVDAHGNCRLPMHYIDSSGQDLYVWLVNQKQSAKTGKMSDERKRLLRAVGALSE